MMSSIARRVATTSLCGMSPSESSHSSLPTRLEKVKFGVSLETLCHKLDHNDLPGPLLMIILKVHKAGPCTKDIFRASGKESSMKELIHSLQNGVMVNLDNYSVTTCASVLKKFLRELPGGVFGAENERRLFAAITCDDFEMKFQAMQSVIQSLPRVTQHLLILLIGTFRAIANHSETYNTGMNAEAISISVAPSFFHSCVVDKAKTAALEDVQRFRIAPTIMKLIIEQFGNHSLFGSENFAYYLRFTSSVPLLEGNTMFAFKYPPSHIPRDISLNSDWLEPGTAQTPDLRAHSMQQLPQHGASATSFGSFSTSSHQLTDKVDALVPTCADAYARMSNSLEEKLFKFATPDSDSPQSIIMMYGLMPQDQPQSFDNIVDSIKFQMEELKSANRYAESTKSLTYLPVIHDRQKKRMKARSEWFLNPKENDENIEGNSPKGGVSSAQAAMVAGSSRTAPPAMTGGGVVKKSSSKEKGRLVRRSSSKKEKSATGSANNSKNLDIK